MSLGEEGHNLSHFNQKLANMEGRRLRNNHTEGPGLGAQGTQLLLGACILGKAAPLPTGSPT